MVKKIAILLIALTVISVGILGGCVQDRSEETEAFVGELSTTEEFVALLLNNIYVDLTDFDTQYKWSILMNYILVISTIDEMKHIGLSVLNEMDDMDSAQEVYYESKLQADMNQLTSQEKSQADTVEDIFSTYQLEENNLLDCLVNVKTYIDFVNYSRIKLILLEDVTNALTLMNNYVEMEDYETAVEKVLEAIQFYHDLKNISFARANLDVVIYSEEDLSLWELYIEGWQYYLEYLNLVIEGKYYQAEEQYDTYEEKYNQILEIEASENVRETNEEIAIWYTANIGVYKDIFIDYYQHK